MSQTVYAVEDDATVRIFVEDGSALLEAASKDPPKLLALITDGVEVD